jgi:protoporphyrinogen/coproporphyrinogen III oxidase
MVKQVSTLVIGGGISGLACAYALQKAGVDVLLVEAAERTGGMIRSERREGYLLELGPQSFSGTQTILDLCRDLGIENELIEAPAGAPRFLLIGGELRAAPLSPPAFFASSLFGANTKWSVVRDVFGHSAPPESDESVAEFTRRKFSAELLDKLVGPFVSGIYAGDPEKLSLRAAFPSLYEAERSAGSVIRGMLRGAKEKARATRAGAASASGGSAERDSTARKKRRPTLQTFREGNETLTRSLTARLGAAARTECCVAEIRRPAKSQDARSRQNYLVVLSGRHGAEQIAVENLALATPTDVSARLLRDASPELSAALSSIEYAPIAVVSLGYAKSAVARELDGFGFLIPRSENVRTLGTVWNSSLFTGRAPAEHVLLTSFAGGATDPGATLLAEAEIVSLVHREIAAILRIQAEPVFSQAMVYRRALPQYNLGHGERLHVMRRAQEAIPGMFLTGNYFSGPAIGTCIEQALAVADSVQARVRAAERRSESDSRTLGASGARA